MSYGLKKQISKLNPKMGFIWRAKHVFSDQIGLMFWERRETVEREEEGEKKRKKMEEPRSSKPRYGTLDFWYGN